jgi:transcriptional regulator with XRE-family HTH domain
MTISDVVRHNVRRYRRQRSLSQRELAELLQSLAGDPKPWTQFRVSDIEGGRKGRDRTISPEEMLTLARGLDISLIELMTPPEVIEIGEDKEGSLLVAPVRVRVGRDEVAPDLFFRLAFMLPPNLREQWGEISYGTADHAGKNSELGWRSSIAHEALDALFTADDLRKRFPGVEQLSLEQLGQLIHENDV